MYVELKLFLCACMYEKQPIQGRPIIRNHRMQTFLSCNIRGLHRPERVQAPLSAEMWADVDGSMIGPDAAMSPAHQQTHADRDKCMPIIITGSLIDLIAD